MELLELLLVLGGGFRLGLAPIPIAVPLVGVVLLDGFLDGLVLGRRTLVSLVAALAGVFLGDGGWGGVGIGQVGVVRRLRLLFVFFLAGGGVERLLFLGRDRVAHEDGLMGRLGLVRGRILRVADRQPVGQL